MSMLYIDLLEKCKKRWSPDADTLDLDPAVFSDICIRADLVREHGRRVLQLTAEADVRMVCDRTLDPFTARLTGTCRTLLQPPGGKASGQGYDEVVAVERAQRRMDIAFLARDTILLAVPQRKVAPHARDIDLEQTFGAPQSGTAPHWAPLLRLHSEP